MSQSKDDFVQHLYAFRSALSLDDVINSGSQGRSASKLLRNGLAVVSFNALEDFFKGRVAEILSLISDSGISFSELPVGLKKASTLSAMTSICNKINLLDDDESKIRFVQEQALKVSSTSMEDDLRLTEYSYGHKGSNIGEAEFSTMLKDFYIKDSWRKLTDISSRFGLSSLSLKDAYVNAAKRRHQAAHVASADTLYDDLRSFLYDSLSIAIALDVVLLECYYKIESSDISYLNNKVLDLTSLDCYHLKYNQGKWKIYLLSRPTRAVKVFQNKQQAEDYYDNSLSINNKIMIVFSDNNFAVGWRSRC